LPKTERVSSLFSSGAAAVRDSWWWRYWALGAILIACLVPEQARGSDLRVVSSFVATGEIVPADCGAEVGIVTRALARRPGPAGWHWVVLCDEAAWRRFLVLSGRPGEDEILASTDLDGRTTYLRGDKLLHPLDFCADPQRVIGHELAHIELQSGDELATEGLSRRQREASGNR
jgi:hypothetical protein